MKKSAVVSIVIAALVVAAGAVAQDKKFSTNAWQAGNSSMGVIVDTTASHIDGQQPWVPIAVTVENKQSEPLVLTRQSFVLVKDDTRLQLGSANEWSSAYKHEVMDVRMEETFIGQAKQYYQGNRLYPLQFFPSRRSGFSARDNMILQQKGDVVHGFIYFEASSADALGDGKVQLIVQPAGADPATLDIDLYKNKKKG
jgi:hypothetical protein